MKRTIISSILLVLSVLVSTAASISNGQVYINGTLVTNDNKNEGDIVPGISYNNGVVTLNNINLTRTPYVLIRTNIDGLVVRLVGDNVIMLNWSTDRSFLVLEEGASATIDGENSGTLTIEQVVQNSYPMFTTYKNASVTIKDVPAINITIGGNVMNGLVYNGGTAKLTIDNSSGKFTSTKIDNVIEHLGSITLIGTKIVSNRKPDPTWYFYSGAVFEFTATGGVAGDLNGDNSVNTGDVSVLYDVILGNENNADVVTRANLNGDDSVNTSDVSTLYDIILNKSN